MPRLSDTMQEGTIAVWLKKPGDEVGIGDVLVEIETDKATMEYEAYQAGTLHDILVPEGGSARIGTAIAHLADGSAPEPSPAPDLTPAPAIPDEPAAGAGRRLFASPLVRRIARENGLDLDRINGSGPGGRIVRADLEDVLPHRPADAAPVAPPDPRRSHARPFDSTRRVISRRLTESHTTTPHFYVTAVADVSELLALRATLNAGLEPAGRPKISVNDLIVRACAIALDRHRGVNASYSAEGNGQTLLHGRVNIGIAVASDTGLVVAVLPDADQKTTSQIAAESKHLAGLAQERKLSPAQLSDGTFTVSNLGMYGIEQFTALINPPQGAILAVGAALPEPTAVDGAVEIRHRMRYTLSADHRIIDGALAAQFLAELTELLEHPLNIIA